MEYDQEALKTVVETRLILDLYDAWLFDEYKPYIGRRILEIGCGFGNQLKLMTDREFVLGLDISDDSTREVQSRFFDYPNISAVCMSIYDPEVINLNQIKFDTVIALNVIEHLEDDEFAIGNAWSVLQPNGNFILVVPAHQWLFGSMDRAIGHYRRYTKRMLKVRMEKIGFSIVLQKYFNMLGAFGWFVNGRILNRKVPPTGQLKLINFLIPFLRSIESRISPSFGISLLTVGQKIFRITTPVR